MERMEEAVTVSYAEFIEKLTEGYLTKSSCCIFFTTANNATGRVIFSDGQIVYLSYANKTGNNAAAIMPEIRSLRYRVGQSRVKFPVDDRLPATELILRNVAPIAGTLTTGNIQVGVSKSERKVIEEILVDMIGPMASFFIEDHVVGASNLQEAINNIIAELNNNEEVNIFKTKLKQKLG